MRPHKETCDIHEQNCDIHEYNVRFSWTHDDCILFMNIVCDIHEQMCDIHEQMCVIHEQSCGIDVNVPTTITETERTTKNRYWHS